MSKIIELPVNINFDEIIATKGTYKPDFRVFTSGIESDRKNTRLVHMVGSSTERDLQKDTMTLNALNDMTKAPANMTVWLNHNYDLPDSIFGSIIGSPVIQHQDGVADLHLKVDVELDNPAAAKVKKYIDNGRRLGCSIGCIVTKYEVPTEEDGENWQQQPINILGVYVVEYSVVGIPCNQRSWVENAIRGVFTRTYDPALAPAMKSLWPTSYKEVIKTAPSEIQERLELISSREKPAARVFWQANTKMFTLSKDNEEKMLTSAQLKSLFAGATMVDASPVVVAPVDDLSDIDIEIEDKEFDLEEDMKKKNVEIDPDGNHAPYSGTHTHVHKSFGGSDNENHSHEHSHDNDNDHAHAHENMVPDGDNDTDDQPEARQHYSAEDIAETPEVPVETKSEDPITIDASTLAMLTSYNVLAKTLNLPEITPEAYMSKAMTQTDSNGLAPHHKQTLKVVHDMLCGMTNGEVCANSPEQMQQAESQAQEAGGDVHPVGSNTIYNQLGDNIAKLTKSVDVYTQYMSDVHAAKKAYQDIAFELLAAKKEIETFGAEMAAIQDTITSLKEMPLGNPVGHNRSVREEDKNSIVSREELLKIHHSTEEMEFKAVDSLSAALALTEIKSYKHGDSYLKYRVWPEGVGGTTAKGVRPELTSNHITYMTYSEILAYRAGKAAKVPYIDSQVSNSATPVTKY